MKNSYTIIVLGFLVLSFISCNSEIKSEKGGIDIITNVYFNASKSLNEVKTFHISKINYSHDTILEIVPNLHFPEANQTVLLIRDSIYYDLGNENIQETIFSDLLHKQKPKSVFEKKIGALFSNDEIPNYRNKKKLSDTILFKKRYKRFEINSPWNYTRFYVYPTDTILPYSLYKTAEKDFSGRIERIDSYNKKTDVFVTLQLFPRKNWDKEIIDLFEFNVFVKNKEHGYK
ncbi:hypothetical protein [Cloacibacterium normanense]|uniref:hypothetical protein n=1 Tax=Cloacibacterium normanense TaxID=237258 RepID=UPI00391C9AAA